jgi:hypothetical protein
MSDPGNQRQIDDLRRQLASVGARLAALEKRTEEPANPPPLVQPYFSMTEENTTTGSFDCSEGGIITRATCHVYPAGSTDTTAELLLNGTTIAAFSTTHRETVALGYAVDDGDDLTAMCTGFGTDTETAVIRCTLLRG